MKVGDIVRWTLPAAFTMSEFRSSPQMGVIVKVNLAHGADIAWFGDDMRVTWTPMSELEVISEAETNRDKDFIDKPPCV